MEMAREVIADKGIWVAKKRYMLNVHNSEGVQYAKPKLKIMGIEAIKSSTPEICRTRIKEAITIIGTWTVICKRVCEVRNIYNILIQILY